MSKPTGMESSILALGAPGLGKSTFAASVAEVVDPEEVLLMICKPGEERSFGYRKHGLDRSAELYHDLGWRPGLGEFRADAYKRLLERLYELQEDEEFGAVIIDPLTDAFKLLAHKILGPSSAASPAEFSDSYGFYRQLKDDAQEFVEAANVLATDLVARPKWVILPMHTQPPKEAPATKVGGGQYVQKQSGDEKAQGVEYEGNVLPQLDGGYRRKLAADVSLVVYCDIESEKKMTGGKLQSQMSYVIQVRPSAEKHAKVRLAPSLGSASLPNSMSALVEAIREAEGGEG